MGRERKKNTPRHFITIRYLRNIENRFGFSKKKLRIVILITVNYFKNCFELSSALKNLGTLETPNSFE